MFDVSMGSYDGAEVCELVGLYLLDKLSSLILRDQIGLYRDDGLAVVNQTSGHKLDRLRKDVIALFKGEGLSITIDTNLTETDFLDVSLNLENGSYSPYRKPDNYPSYINANSNHPPSIIKELPNMVNKRLRELSSSKNEFESAKGIYNSALKNSGYAQNLAYEKEHNTSQSKQWKRKVIWFNPPFNKSVKTRIGKVFLRLVKQHFPKHHRFHKIFNLSTIKVSYSCTTNMVNNIKKHNSKILQIDRKKDPPKCNCRNKNNCPLNGDCQEKCLVYKATVTTENDSHVYYGQCEGEFKARYNNHTKSFRHRKYENETELSKHVWLLKDSNKSYKVVWCIVARAPPYKSGSGRCALCLTEKSVIVRANPKGLLNKRTELISKCRHRNKYLLCNIPSPQRSIK